MTAAPEPTVDASVERSRPALDPVAVAAFLTNLSHVLRSPVAIVSGAIAELRADAGKVPAGEQLLLVDLADRGLLRLVRIADTVSLLAAASSGAITLSRQSLDLVEVARAAMARAARVEPRREVEMLWDLPEAPCPVLGDEARLGHAIGEIMINAIRHARGRARLVLAVTPGLACVAIEDDGRGVSAEARASLFQRFAYDAAGAGLGMGLSLAHDVIVQHGGSLSLEPSTLPPGRPGTVGARFVIALPVAGQA